MIKKRIIKMLFCSVFFLLGAFVFAQTAAELDIVLQADTVSAAQAARFVLGAAGLLPPGLSGPAAESTAYETARSNGWLKSTAGESVSLKETAFLIMRAFELKGGILYSLFKNPRYAYREMVYRKLIQGRTDQSMKMSGRRLLLILDRTLAYTGGSQ